jgi:hypothetical protein
VNYYAKWLIVGFLATLIVACLCYLFHNSYHEAAIFIAQSIVDNAIFCLMFLAVVVITGISC